jgi:hypothetical protein
MISYQGRRNLAEGPSVYALDGQALEWTRSGKPAVRLPLADVRLVRLAYADAPIGFWVATVKGRGGTVRISSASYRKLGVADDQMAAFAPFIRGLHGALQARPGGPPPFTLGDPVIAGVWGAVAALLGLVVLFAAAVVVLAALAGNWSEAFWGGLGLIFLVTWAPACLRSLKANRPRPLNPAALPG